MKKLIIIGLLTLGYFNTVAQNITKQEALNALQQTLNNQMVHVSSYGNSNESPCWYYRTFSFDSGFIKLSQIIYEFSTITIEYSVEAVVGSKNYHSILIDMTKYFVPHKFSIYESKVDQFQITDDNRCTNLTSVAIPLKEGSNASLERAIKILNYLKRFAEKDPFDK